jgi:hypothetical protein
MPKKSHICFHPEEAELSKLTPSDAPNDRRLSPCEKYSAIVFAILMFFFEACFIIYSYEDKPSFTVLMLLWALMLTTGGAFGLCWSIACNKSVVLLTRNFAIMPGTMCFITLMFLTMRFMTFLVKDLQSRDAIMMISGGVCGFTVVGVITLVLMIGASECRSSKVDTKTPE